MKVGIPSEVKNNEFRVGITPVGVHELVRRGHDVFVQKGAGLGSSITDEEYVTQGATILDTADGRLEWASAGHPPPLLWGPDTPPAFLSGTPDQPLGTGGDVTIHSDRLAVGEMVAMYTDGLVAFEGRSLAQGSELLSGAAARALAAGGSDVPGHLGDLICDRLLREMAKPDTEGDDAAMLLLRRRTH